MSNLDLEIKKALNNKIDLDKFMLFTVKVDSETKIDFRINKNTNDQLTIIASYDQMPYRIEHRYKNVTITYSTWDNERCADVTTENIHLEGTQAFLLNWLLERLRIIMASDGERQREHVIKFFDVWSEIYGLFWW